MTSKELKSYGNSIINKHVECIFTGMIVTGTVTELFEDKYTIGVMIKYDKPHNWGGEYYTKGDAFARKIDDFGTLKHLKIIE